MNNDHFIDIAIDYAMRGRVDDLRQEVKDVARALAKRHPGVFHSPPWLLCLSDRDVRTVTFYEAVLDYVLDYNYPLDNESALRQPIYDLVDGTREHLLRFFSEFQMFDRTDILDVLHAAVLFQAVHIADNRKAVPGVRKKYSPVRKLLGFQ